MDEYTLIYKKIDETCWTVKGYYTNLNLLHEHKAELSNKGYYTEYYLTKPATGNFAVYLNKQGCWVKNGGEVLTFTSYDEALHLATNDYKNSQPKVKAYFPFEEGTFYIITHIYSIWNKKFNPNKICIKEIYLDKLKLYIQTDYITLNGEYSFCDNYLFNPLAHFEVSKCR